MKNTTNVFKTNVETIVGDRYKISYDSRNNTMLKPGMHLETVSDAFCKAYPKLANFQAALVKEKNCIYGLRIALEHQTCFTFLKSGAGDRYCTVHVDGFLTTCEISFDLRHDTVTLAAEFVKSVTREYKPGMSSRAFLNSVSKHFITNMIAYTKEHVESARRVVRLAETLNI